MWSWTTKNPFLAFSAHKVQYRTNNEIAALMETMQGFRPSLLRHFLTLGAPKVFHGIIIIHFRY